MKRLLRTLALCLFSVAAISVTAGCVVVPEGGGGYYHDHYHEHYWNR
jgi:hypothetical protein